MSPVSKIDTESGIVLFVEKRVWEDSVEVLIKAENIKEPFILHWGLRKEPDGSWNVPPKQDWPSGSHPFDHAALQNLMEPGSGQVVIRIDRDSGFGFMDFVLFFPAQGNWDNNLGRNYRVELPPAEKEKEQEQEKPENQRTAPEGKSVEAAQKKPEAAGAKKTHKTSNPPPKAARTRARARAQAPQAEGKPKEQKERKEQQQKQQQQKKQKGQKKTR